jgi:hypothetical protein
MGSVLQAPGAPEISHLIPGVPPPAALYISPNEQLVVDSWAYAAQEPVFIKLRMLRPGGYVDTTVYLHQPNSDRSQHTTYHDLAEGHLLTAMVYSPGTNYKRGQVWMNVGLQRGEGPVGIYHHQLIAGYVTNCSALVWPWAQIQSSVEGPGLIRSVAGADPAAGAEILVTVPARARWRLIAMRFTFTTDATTTTRYVAIVLDDGAVPYYTMSCSVGQTASCHNLLYCIAGHGLNGVIGPMLAITLQRRCLLGAGYRISTLTQGLTAGDDLSAPQLLVEEWIEP